MSAFYEEIVDHGLGATLRVDFTTRHGRVVAYSVVLLLAAPGGMETIRLYDSAHGYNEMHRYGRLEGKREGTRFHGGTLAEGLRTAICEVKDGYAEMIEGWASQ